LKTESPNFLSVTGERNTFAASVFTGGGLGSSAAHQTDSRPTEKATTRVVSSDVPRALATPPGSHSLLRSFSDKQLFVSGQYV
jgi:hypothetical protein